MGIEQELVSIILPTYNRAYLLPKAINSVLEQNYQNWELIVWDDGSTDDTESVLAAFKDPRILCYHEENHGMSYALNRGLELAKGDLIAFLDDDDTWLPEKLEFQLSVMEEFPQIDLVFGNFININMEDKSQNLGFDQVESSLALLVTEKQDQDIWLIDQGFLEGVSMDNFIAFDTVIIRKRVFDLIGIFNESLRTGMDFELWWRFGLAGLKPAFTRDVVLNRVKYPGSLSGRSLQASLNRLQTLEMCKELAIKQDRRDLVDLLEAAYRNAWQNMIIIHGDQREKKKAWQAFIQSLKYGFSLGSVKLIIKALFFANSLYSPKKQ